MIEKRNEHSDKIQLDETLDPNLNNCSVHDIKIIKNDEIKENDSKKVDKRKFYYLKIFLF